jgi:hypothetical protein
VRIATVGLVAFLLAVSPAQATVRATGVLNEFGNRYTLTVINNGDEPIRCMRFTTPNGELVTAVDGPGTPASFGPGFSAQMIEIPPGGTSAWAVTISPKPPKGQGGTLDVSSTCVFGSDVSSKVVASGADLFVSMTTRASYLVPTPESRELAPNQAGKVRVEATATIVNRGPEESPGGTLTFTFPPRSTPLEVSFGDDFPRAEPTVTLSFGPIAVSDFRSVRFTYLVEPASGKHVSSIVVNGVNDPTTPETARSEVFTYYPVSTFPRPSGGLFEDLRKGRDFRVRGTASPGSFSSRHARAAATPPVFDAANARRVVRVEVAFLRLVPGTTRALAPACQWLRRASGGFKRVAPDRGRCNVAVWLRAKGTGNWSLDLPNGLPAGRYVAITRAVNGLGISDTSFTARERNRLYLEVR